MPDAPRIILLNGAGSAGKSSIARAIQDIAATPFLHVQMDAFLEMLPERLQDAPDGIGYARHEVDGRPVVAATAGPLGERVLDGMRHAVAALAARGNELIVDDVAEAEAIADYRRLLSPFALRVVGVFAPLDVLEERERARGDRLAGLARFHFGRIHAGISYDLEVDTAHETPGACARRICEAFGL